MSEPPHSSSNDDTNEYSNSSVHVGTILPQLSSCTMEKDLPCETAVTGDNQDTTTSRNGDDDFDQQKQQQQQHEQQQVHVLLEAIHILSQLAQMDGSRYQATRDSFTVEEHKAPDDNDNNSNNSMYHHKRHHALCLQQRLDQLGRQWKLEDTGIPLLNQAIHRWHSQGLEYQTLLDRQDVELRQAHEQLRHMQQVILPKMQRKCEKYKQRAKVWQHQYRQQQDERKSIVKVVKHYVHSLQRGNAKQLAEAHMAYQLHVHEHTLKQQQLQQQQRATTANTRYSSAAAAMAASSSSFNSADLLSTPPLAQRLSFSRKQQQGQQQQQQLPGSTNRMRTFSKESTASSDLSDGLDFQYDQEEVLHQLEDFEEEEAHKEGEEDDDEEEDDEAFSVTTASSSSNSSRVTDQGVATLQLAPAPLLHSSSSSHSVPGSSSSSWLFSSPYSSDKKFSLSFSTPPPLLPLQNATTTIEKPVYTIQVAVGSLCFCKVPIPPPPPPVQQQLLPLPPKNIKPAPKGLLSLKSSPNDYHKKDDDMDNKNDAVDVSTTGAPVPPTTSLSSSVSMKSFGLDRLMGKHQQQQSLTEPIPFKRSTSSPSNGNAVVDPTEYAFLVCGFKDDHSGDEATSEVDDSAKPVVTRPTLGARLVAIQGQSLSVSGSMTVQDLYDAMMKQASTSSTSTTAIPATAVPSGGDDCIIKALEPNYISLSFRNDELTKAQHQLLDKAIVDHLRRMQPMTHQRSTMPSSLPLTNSDNFNGSLPDIDEKQADVVVGEGSHHRQPHMLFQSFLKLTTRATNQNGELPTPNVTKQQGKRNDSSLSELSMEEVGAAGTSVQHLEGSSLSSTTTTTNGIRGMTLPLFMKPKQPETKNQVINSREDHQEKNSGNIHETEAVVSVTEARREEEISFPVEDVSRMSAPATSSTVTGTPSFSGVNLTAFLKSTQERETKNELKGHDDHPDISSDVHLDGKEGQVAAHLEDHVSAAAITSSSICDASVPLCSKTELPNTSVDEVIPESKYSADNLVQTDVAVALQEPENVPVAGETDASAPSFKFQASMKQVGRFFGGFRGTE